jgi:hypothetical protein
MSTAGWPDSSEQALAGDRMEEVDLARADVDVDRVARQ